MPPRIPGGGEMGAPRPPVVKGGGGEGGKDKGLAGAIETGKGPEKAGAVINSIDAATQPQKADILVDDAQAHGPEATLADMGAGVLPPVVEGDIANDVPEVIEPVSDSAGLVDVDATAQVSHAPEDDSQAESREPVVEPSTDPDTVPVVGADDSDEGEPPVVVASPDNSAAASGSAPATVDADDTPDVDNGAVNNEPDAPEGDTPKPLRIPTLPKDATPEQIQAFERSGYGSLRELLENPDYQHLFADQIMMWQDHPNTAINTDYCSNVNLLNLARARYDKLPDDVKEHFKQGDTKFMKGFMKDVYMKDYSSFMLANNPDHFLDLLDNDNKSPEAVAFRQEVGNDKNLKKAFRGEKSNHEFGFGRFKIKVDWDERKQDAIGRALARKDANQLRLALGKEGVKDLLAFERPGADKSKTAMELLKILGILTYMLGEPIASSAMKEG